jgi:hypothetical protein
MLSALGTFQSDNDDIPSNQDSGSGPLMLCQLDMPSHALKHHVASSKTIADVIKVLISMLATAKMGEWAQDCMVVPLVASKYIQGSSRRANNRSVAISIVLQVEWVLFADIRVARRHTTAETRQIVVGA